MIGKTFAAHVSAINYFLKLRGRELNIAKCSQLQMLKTGMTNTAAKLRVITQFKRRALVRPLIHAMLGCLETRNRTNQWRRLALLLGHDGMLRCSNLTYYDKEPDWYLCPKHITFLPSLAQPDRIRIRLPGSKTNHINTEEIRIIHCVCAKNWPCTVHLLLPVYQARQHDPGAWLFAKQDGSPYYRHDLEETLLNCCDFLDLEYKYYTPHALRIGGATWLWWHQHTVAEIAHKGNWRSDSVLTYLRSENPDLIKIGYQNGFGRILPTKSDWTNERAKKWRFILK